MRIKQKTEIPLCDITLFLGHSSDSSMKKTRMQQRKTADEEHKENEKKKIKLENYQEGEELSEYEKMVQRNREEKMMFLQSLRIDECKEEFKEAVTNLIPVKPKTPRIKVFKKPRAIEVTPVRKSRRLAKLDINLSENALFEKAIIEAKHEEEQKVLPVCYSFKEAAQDEEDYLNFSQNFKFQPMSKSENNSYATNFKQMKLQESHIAKVVPARITTLAVHPATDKIIVIAGSKYGNLGFWNVNSDSSPIVFTPHKEGVTNVKVNPSNSLQIISSSYDGTMRCGDMEKNVFNEIYNVSNETCCTYFDFLSSNTFIVSQKNGNVCVVDVRHSSRSQKTHECHDYSVKTVSIHPMNKSLFLTADTKGIMKLWDLRKLQKKPIIRVAHHKRSISSAFFSPATGKSILTTSLDDSLCLFDSSKIEEEILFSTSIKHNNHTGRWLSPFRATWAPNSDEIFVVGSMHYPRRIEIFNNNGNNVYNFSDENLSSVTSVNQFHPSLNILAGANSSGKVFVFMDVKQIL